ncbi:hypothetical protein [Paenarthrobacter sp. PH39-S1]|uniref:hypothetical protein n=1 Tax=Paenarthrobacter sp. PH39-S1 TaxID=3046204 RepID=UPI0024B9C894|nr:hypothetical protein [Paenarthrobacter sp. PH39-S1]MDJ0357016.1 hypothetical protein [Paenarthrobacter sp. PH39-S1]
MVILLILLWIGTETVLSMTGRTALLVSPPTIGPWLSGLPGSGLAARRRLDDTGDTLAGVVIGRYRLQGNSRCPAPPSVLKST